MSFFKLIASFLYGAITDFRRVLYDRELLSVYYSPLPVVSVGNLTVGGNGKSPFVAFLVERLAERGYRPVILLRGYRGAERGPYRVRLTDSPAQVGDEALMHARRFGDAVPVVVARKRATGAQFVEREQLGDVIILDDGFQHRALGRQIDIVLWASTACSPSEEFSRARLLPLGRLRERIVPALRRAHALIWVQKGSAEGFPTASIASRCLPEYRLVLQPHSLRDVYDGSERELVSLRGVACRSISAIADPESFSATLTESCGARVLDSLFKRDHDLFSLAEWREFSQLGEGIVICTEKDEEKLRCFLTGSGELYSLRLSGSLGADEAELLERLERALPRPKPRSVQKSASL